MKKLILSIMALATMTFAFTSCEDVPEPYALPTEGTNPTAPAVEPMGTGTQDDPYNVTAALAKIKAQEADKNSEPIYVKGKICEITSVETANYGNATYYISDDGTNNVQSRLYIYQSMYLGNKKFTSEDQIKVGDEVIVYGPFVLYKGSTPETAGKGASYIYSLNGKTSASTTPTTPEGTDLNTESTPFTVAEAIKKINDNGGKELSGEAYVKGIIAEVTSYSDKYKSITYYISDNGTEKALQIYSGKGKDGADFTSKDDLKVGQTVVVKGILKAYTDKAGKVTLEMDKNNKIISIK